MSALLALALAVPMAMSAESHVPFSAATATATCTGSVGPGIPAPAQAPSGIPGFHASWFGQSGYPTLCPGEKSTATVAYYNSGARGWVKGKMGEVAYLGTWGPAPGQDRTSPLGGDGTTGSASTGWPRYNRIAIQPAAYVGPGQVAWFQFTIQAPVTPGKYKLYLRPLIEGVTWLEDFGVFWQVTVLNADGTHAPPLAPAGCLEWPSFMGLIFAKLPTPENICLRHDRPLASTIAGQWSPGANTVWIAPQSSLNPTLLGHEVCHSHQSQIWELSGKPSGGSMPGWYATDEGKEFIALEDRLRVERPSGVWIEWRSPPNYLESFASFCGWWYYPPGKITEDAYRSAPGVLEFTAKWLPK